MFNKPVKASATGRTTPIVTSVDTLPPPIPTPVKRAPVVPSSVSASSASSRMAKAPSVVSSDMAIKGSVLTTGDVQVDGIVEGDIQAGKLIIGDSAQVFGEVIAESIEVRGRIVGSIRARKTHLYSSAHIEGDIITAVFAVESGAFFDGRCKHDQDPLKGLIAQPEASTHAEPSLLAYEVEAVSSEPVSVSASASADDKTPELV